MHSITVAWPDEENEHGAPMLWFGSWLRGNDGSEGRGFYSGRGGDKTNLTVPPDATCRRMSLMAVFSGPLACRSSISHIRRASTPDRTAVPTRWQS